MYSKTVNYIGLNGQKKEKVLNFIIQRSDVLDNEESFKQFEEVKDMLLQLDPKSTLSKDQSMTLMRTVLDIIKLGYAEVNFDEDIIDKSPEVRRRFENSLAYDALLTEIVERPELAIELVEGISNSMNLSEKEQTEADKLRAEFVAKTTRQNDFNQGQDIQIPESTHRQEEFEPYIHPDMREAMAADLGDRVKKSAEIIELEKRLAELKGDK